MTTVTQVTVGANDPKRSRIFYDGVLASLGWTWGSQTWATTVRSRETASRVSSRSSQPTAGPRAWETALPSVSRRQTARRCSPFTMRPLALGGPNEGAVDPRGGRRTPTRATRETRMGTSWRSTASPRIDPRHGARSGLDQSQLRRPAGVYRHLFVATPTEMTFSVSCRRKGGRASPGRHLSVGP